MTYEPAAGCLKLIPEHNYEEVARPRPNLGVHRCVDCGKTITTEVVVFAEALED